MDAKQSRSTHKSLRLPGFDYSTPGKYFITTCCHERHTHFGHVNDGAMLENDLGKCVAGYWKTIPRKFPTVKLHEFVVMPNHFHGIVELLWVDPVSMASSFGVVAPKLPRVIAWWKSICASAYRQGEYSCCDTVARRLWQRGYHERVIRNEAEYLAIAEYIQTNPLRWHLDRYHQ